MLIDKRDKADFVEANEISTPDEFGENTPAWIDLGYRRDNKVYEGSRNKFKRA